MRLQAYQPQVSQVSIGGGSKKPKYDPKKAHLLVQGAFHCFDIDNSGCLKKTEFIKFLKRIVVDLGGEDPSIEECQDILWELDKNGDGEISKEEITVLFEELIRIMGTFPQKKSQLPKKDMKKRNSI